MPELPEVETTRRGIIPHVVGKPITGIIVRDRRLRWPVSPRLAGMLVGQSVERVERRAKYLLFYTSNGCMILHLGMSGSLRLVDATQPVTRHDHVELIFAGGQRLRFHDPRRFGSIHWTSKDPLQHRLLRALGPEPLAGGFDGDYLYNRARGRRAPVKTFLMDSRIVVGVGNIYASEALFRSGIHPRRAAGRIGRGRYETLAAMVRSVLEQALQSGGTTLRDFVNGNGEPGYFRRELLVYDRAGEPCRRCGTLLRRFRLSQRSTFFCPACQR